MKLSEWEERLIGQFERIELIGELDVSEQELAQMSSKIRACIERYGFKVGLGTLLKNYHHTWMTYVVFKGVYGYSEGDYWTSVADAVGIENRQSLTVWGRLFCKSLERFGLPTFPELTGLKYVMRILLHGGIPQSALPNFFDYFLAQPIAHPETARFAPEDLIDYLTEYSSAQSVLTKPVYRFLTSGGRFAVDFVARCLDLARTHALTGQVPTAKQTGLPDRVVQAYLQWNQERSAPVRRMAVRLQRPQIVLDAYGDGVVAILPSQPLENRALLPEAFWGITMDDTSLRQSVRVYRRQNGWQTEEDQIILSRPYGECRIAFEDGRELAQTWRFTGLDSRRPLLLFDAETGRHKNWGETIPTGHYWLVYPRTYSLHITHGKLVENAGILPWDWGNNYQAERWDLSAAKSIELRSTSQRAGATNPIAIPVVADISVLRPWLVGGELVSSCHTSIGSGQVYSGKLPIICIPIPMQRTPDSELIRWQIVVLQRETGYRRELSLAHSTIGVRIVDNHIHVDLVTSGLLTPEPFGEYEILMRGPLGRDTNFSLVSVPNLQIIGGEKVRLTPPGQVSPTGRLRIRCAEWLELDTFDSDVAVERERIGLYTVVVPSSKSQIELRLRSSRSKKGEIASEIFLQTSLPILQWAVVGGKQLIGNADWHTVPISQPKHWLDQTNMPQLVVSIAPVTAMGISLSGALSVIYDSTGSAQILTPISSSRRFLCFDLRALLDTVRSSHLARIVCSLEIESLSGHSSAISVPVLYFSQSFNVQNVSLKAIQADNQWQLTLTWESETKLTGREIRLWSLSRPWNTPVRLPIPDSADNECEWHVVMQDLFPGKYRLQMVVGDPWIHESLIRPVRNDPNSLDVILGSQAEISAYMSQLPPSVEGYLERALLYENDIHRLDAFKKLSTVFDRCDIPFALDALMHMAEEEGLEDAFRRQNSAEVEVFQSLLLRQVKDLIQYIADITSVIDHERQTKLRKLLVALGLISVPLNSHKWLHELTPRQLEMIWGFWPALATLIESHQLVLGVTGAWNRANTRLGLSFLNSSSSSGNDNEEEDNENTGGNGDLHWFPNLLVPEYHEGPPEEYLLQASADRLRYLARELNIVPSGLLSEDQWLIANLAWLINCKRSQRGEDTAVSWLKKNIDWLSASVHALTEDGRVAPELLSLVSQRFTRRDRNLLALLPFAVGATALILRLLAHDSRTALILRKGRADRDLVGVQMMEFAPDLFDRDLCLFELMLAQISQSKEIR